jgi:hypothetical protein
VIYNLEIWRNYISVNANVVDGESY